MVFTNGPRDNKPFGSRVTKKEYPFFVYIFIFILILTAYFLIFKLNLHAENKPSKEYVVPFMNKQQS